MSKRYAMTVDMRTCVGCSACVQACKAENDVPDGHSRSWIAEEVSGKLPDLHAEIRSERCNQCDQPACVSACPTGASWVAEGGVVLVSKDKCTGCKACMAACPYGARFVHPEGHVDKCTFCLHRVQRGQDPACVEICPTASLRFGDLNDRRSEASQVLARERTKTLSPEIGTEPQLFFVL